MACGQPDWASVCSQTLIFVALLFADPAVRADAVEAATASASTRPTPAM
jgi:hypothetical protein